MVVAFLRGIFSYIEAFNFIFKAGLWRYFVYSGLIGLALLGLFGGLIYAAFDPIGAWIVSWLPWDIQLGSTIAGWISVIIGSVLFLAIFKYLVLIFTAPVMSALSAKVEHYLDQSPGDTSSLGSVVQEISRGVRVSIRNLLRELAITLVLLILGFVPMLAIATGPLILLVQSYFAGFGNIDLWAERHFNYRDTLRFMASHKGMLIGNGIVFVVLLAIPIVGVIIAPPLATIAGTLHAHRVSFPDSDLIS